MPFITILFAIDLLLTGIIGYQVTGAKSPTALIPAGIGLLMLIAGVSAIYEKCRKHAMHGAVLIGLLGFLGTMTSFGDLLTMLQGNLSTLKSPEASVSKVVTAMICGHFVLICIWSFLEIRWSRAKAPTA